MASSTPSPDRGAPLGKSSPDELVKTTPQEPAKITRLEGARSAPGGANPGGGQRKAPGNEEPEPALEPDLPTDGRDELGEAMIRNLPRRQDLSEPPPEPAARN